MCPSAYAENALRLISLASGLSKGSWHRWDLQLWPAVTRTDVFNPQFVSIDADKGNCLFDDMSLAPYQRKSCLEAHPSSWSYISCSDFYFFLQISTLCECQGSHSGSLLYFLYQWNSGPCMPCMQKPCITMPHQAKLLLLSVISPAFLFPKAYSIDPKREIALNQNPDSSISLRCILIKSHKCLISPGWPRHWPAFSETRKKLSSGTIILFQCQNKTLQEILDFNDDWGNSVCYIRGFNSFYKLQWQLALACKKLTTSLQIRSDG